MELPLPDGRRLDLARPRIAGILNVTPDSFSDGGRFADVTAAMAHAAAMLDEGADIIDVGGESTRPGAARIPGSEQIARVVPVIQAVRRLIDERSRNAAISIDTTRADAAAAALDAGATIINDISAGRDDDAMFALAASRRVPLILMHMQGTPATMQANPTYDDVVAEVKAFLLERAAAAERAGIPRSRIVIDPGIGFGKTVEHNLALLAHLDAFVATGYAVMLGASRKRFLRVLANLPDPLPDVNALVVPTCITTALAVQAGVHLLRVHDVAPNHHAATLTHAIIAARRQALATR